MTTTVESHDAHRLRREGITVGVTALVVNIVVRVVAGVLGVPFRVTSGGDTTEVTVVQVAVSTVVGVVMALVALWVLRRFRRGVTIWTALATVAVLASLAQPLAAADDASTALVLVLMHLVVYLLAVLRLRPAA